MGLDLAQHATCKQTFTWEEGLYQWPEGYSWQQILAAAAAAVGNHQPRFIQVPRPLLKGIGTAAGGLAMFTRALDLPGLLAELGN